MNLKSDLHDILTPTNISLQKVETTENTNGLNSADPGIETKGEIKTAQLTMIRVEVYNDDRVNKYSNKFSSHP